MPSPDRIRNFCIIAHIDHGKSTLADRLIEITQTIPKREMRDQVLDQMDIERERGITIKLQPVTMNYNGHELNLIDTPGHVDFTYEVSRSLAAVEGAILLVDATQGIQAQTISNLYLALDHHLEIIPVINKIDLPGADVEGVSRQIEKLLGAAHADVLRASGKTGQGVRGILDAVVKRIPPPRGQRDGDVRALIFDSLYDSFRGVIAFCRVMDGTLQKGDAIRFIGTSTSAEVLEVGRFAPRLVAASQLSAGEIGYVVTNVKSVRESRVGDTIVRSNDHTTQALPGYRTLQPMVFAGVFPREGNAYPALRDGLEKLHLNDAALTYDAEHSPALGFGFRCGLLGLLHLEIVQERLRREYQLEAVVTVPSVAYRVHLNDAGVAARSRKIKGAHNHQITISSPQELPNPTHRERIEEPWVRAEIVTPAAYMGQVMQFVQDSGGVYLATEYLDEGRVVLRYELPLTGIVVNFYDKLKSASSGYASLSYEVIGYRPCDVQRLDIIVSGEVVEALASIVYTKETQRVGRAVVERLKEVLPRQLFEVRIQAAVGSSIVASERIPPLRKDVTAKLYGGDVTRKRKLLEKQKKGKKRMREAGRVALPQEAFLAVLKRS